MEVVGQIKPNEDTQDRTEKIKTDERKEENDNADKNGELKRKEEKNKEYANKEEKNKDETDRRRNNEENNKNRKTEERNKESDSETVAQLGRVLPPKEGIRACEMKEDAGGSRFPHYRGYVLALAGSDYTVVACGVGHIEGQALPPLDVTYTINDTALMASHGFHNDVIYFNRDMQKKIDQCEATLGKPMSLLGMAGIVKALLYNRRFFTFFKCNILAGLDQHGGGCLHVFDMMGGFKREAFAAGGSSSINMQNLLSKKISLRTSRSVQVPHTQQEAADIVTDVFRVAAEQKIFNGHSVVIHTITKSGTVEEFRRVK